MQLAVALGRVKRSCWEWLQEQVTIAVAFI